MDINAGIIDQQITGVLDRNIKWFNDRFGDDENKKRSAAFVLICISNHLGISEEESLELLTEGSNDAGIDGLYLGEVEDGEFPVTIFQGKYKIRDMNGEANFPENSVQKIIQTAQVFFNPARDTIKLNPHLESKIEEIRSLILDGYIPGVKIILCNNGKKWNEQAQKWIDKSGLPENQTQWIHFNHNSIVDILRNTTPVNDSLQLVGKAIFENFDYRRVVIGKVSVSEISNLFNRHNDTLLERNIRRYLGLHKNRVNTAIFSTLENKDNRKNFYFFNNGITIICKNFKYNALQDGNYQLKLEEMQIVNGGQTCKTIQQTLNNLDGSEDFGNTYVMVRIYELDNGNKDFVTDITHATNSQNPVDLRDLRSNDELQEQLGIGMEAIGYTYKRHREQGSISSETITSSIAAEAVLAIWRKRPHQAKFRRKEHFGKFYEDIFKELNGAQAIIATLIFRQVENERKRPSSDNPPEFLPYASHYIAMLVGEQLLEKAKISLNELSHRNLDTVKTRLSQLSSEFQQQAHIDISKALKNLYGERELSLQQLSATFRRGDLLEMLGTT